MYKYKSVQKNGGNGNKRQTVSLTVKYLSPENCSELGKTSLAAGARRIKVSHEVTGKEFAWILTTGCLIDFRLKVLDSNIDMFVVHACDLGDTRCRCFDISRNKLRSDRCTGVLDERKK
jgi:hypothetical protein